MAEYLNGLLDVNDEEVQITVTTKEIKFEEDKVHTEISAQLSAYKHASDEIDLKFFNPSRRAFCWRTLLKSE